MPFVQRRKPSQESVLSPPSVHALGCLVALTSTTQCCGHDSSLQFVFPIRWNAHPRRNRSVSFGGVSSSSRKTLLFKRVSFPDVSCSLNPTLLVEAEVQRGLGTFSQPPRYSQFDVDVSKWPCPNVKLIGDFSSTMSLPQPSCPYLVSPSLPTLVLMPHP